MHKSLELSEWRKHRQGEGFSRFMTNTKVAVSVNRFHFPDPPEKYEYNSYQTYLRDYSEWEKEVLMADNYVFVVSTAAAMSLKIRESERIGFATSISTAKQAADELLYYYGAKLNE